MQDKQFLASEMAAEVPLVIESQKLLEKLRQNKLEGSTRLVLSVDYMNI